MNKFIIDADKKRVGINFKELKQYFDLFYILAYRDIRVRYAQTFLGFVWALIQPVATLLVFILIFGKAIKIDTGNIPYALFAISGIASWTYFSFVLNQSGQSIILAQEMIKKIYFPRLVIPLSKAIVGFIDFAVAIILLIILMIIYRFEPSSNIWFAPIFVLFNIMAALGAGIWLSALTIRYRDFQHIIPFLVQFGLYATPVAYPARLVPEKYLWLYNLNPMTGVIEGFRWSIFGVGEINGYTWISISMIPIIFISSLIYFKSVEDIMADIV